MILDYIITSNCDKAIKKYLAQSFYTLNDIQYQEYFATLDKIHQRKIMYDIIVAQAQTLKDNIEACKTTTLTGFGTFKYREGKKRAEHFRNELANDYGYDRFKDIENEGLRSKIITKVSSIKRELFITEHIDKIKLGKSYQSAKVYKLNRKSVK
jgi:hypothetical protein